MLSAKIIPRQPFFRPKSPFSMADIERMDLAQANQSPARLQHIFIVTGPAGCGKTTVAQFLASRLSVPYVEGDDFHTATSKEKMGNGIPLTDDDRWDWLNTLREEAVRQLQQSDIVVVTCSALKRKYRDVMRVASDGHPTVNVHFIYLKVDEETLQERVSQRVGHYMKEGMVHSQMTALEEPNAEPDVMPIDVTNDKEFVQMQAFEKVKAKLEEYKSAEVTSQT